MSMIADSLISSQVQAPSELSAVERDAMFDLFSRHFEGVHREQFEQDLFGKNVILTLRDRTNGALTGFSTMLVYETRTRDGSPISVVYSGDTIVDPSAWNSAAL